MTQASSLSAIARPTVGATAAAAATASRTVTGENATADSATVPNTSALEPTQPLRFPWLSRVNTALSEASGTPTRFQDVSNLGDQLNVAA